MPCGAPVDGGAARLPVYEQLTGDFGTLNDRTLRAALNDVRRQFRVWQRDMMVFQFCRPAWERFVRLAELSGAIARPAGMSGAGFMTVVCVAGALALHLSDAQARAFRLADNRIALDAGWDDAMLSAELGRLQEDGVDLELLGFADDELDRLLAGGDGDGGGATDEDAVPDPPADPVTRPGDLWSLGSHRLLCGDATVATDVERLLGGVVPHLMVTDPPYGVDYDPSWRNEAGVSATARTGKVAHDDRADWRDAWALFPGDVAYVWHAGVHGRTVADSLEACGFAIRTQIVWAKPRFALGRGDYHWQREPCQPAGTMVQKVVERGTGS